MDENQQMTEETTEQNEALLGWKRALADYDNLKKEMIRDRARTREICTRDAVEAILPVLDHFDQALKFAPEGLEGQVKNWVTGVLHVRNQLEEALKQLGLEPFGAIGDAFDAHKHVGASMRTESDKPDQTILEVVQRGWKINETILRPATVVINELTTN